MQRSSGRAGFGDVEVERVFSPRRLAGLRRRRGARGGEGDPERQDQQTRTAARGTRSTGATWCFGDIYASIACPARPRGASRRPAPARRPRRATRTWDERRNMRTATRRPEPRKDANTFGDHERRSARNGRRRARARRARARATPRRAPERQEALRVQIDRRTQPRRRQPRKVSQKFNFNFNVHHYAGLAGQIKHQNRQETAERCPEPPQGLPIPQKQVNLDLFPKSCR